MNLWIIHHYATLPNLNGHIRPFRFAQHLKNNGINTTIFAASYQHFSGENLIKDKRKYRYKVAGDIPFVFVRTPDGSGGAARIKNMLAFYKGLFNCADRYAKKNGKPDMILASSPQPFAMLAGIQIARKYGIPCICEVRDLWPEAVFKASKIKEKSLLGKILTAGEHWMYKHADALVFTKEGDTDYLKEQKWTLIQGGDIDIRKCFYINNGIELAEYEREITKYIFSDEDLESDAFKVIYAGAIRPVNNVANIIEAAKLLPQDGNIQILIYGDGNQKEELQKRVQEEKIINVKFKGFVEKKYLPYILSRSSVNLLNYSSENYNWSRGNSSNKLFEYLASGKPVISTVKTGYSIIEKYQCGLEMARQTPQGLADAILQIRNMNSMQYQKFCRNAKRGAEEFDYGKLSLMLLDVIAWTRGKRNV